MNALASPGPRPATVEPMTVLQVDAVAAIEAQAYAFPWSRGNFIDSLAAGYLAEVLIDTAQQVIGYYVAMRVVDELHLLNITIAPPAQRQGHAVRLLHRVVEQARDLDARTVWLEVRESNARARGIYERYGFDIVGRRPGYYPASGGMREDALLMSLPLPADAGRGPSKGGGA